MLNTKFCNKFIDTFSTISSYNDTYGNDTMFYIIFEIIAFFLHIYTMHLTKNILKLYTCLFKRDKLISNNYNTQFEFVILSI